jgi:hypothetical protein
MTMQIQDLDSLEIAIFQERLRQARHSFNVALVSATACGITGLVGLSLVLLGRTSEGSIIAAGSITPIAACVQLAREANNRLDRVSEKIQEHEGSED